MRSPAGQIQTLEPCNVVSGATHGAGNLVVGGTMAAIVSETAAINYYCQILALQQDDEAPQYGSIPPIVAVWDQLSWAPLV